MKESTRPGGCEADRGIPRRTSEGRPTSGRLRAGLLPLAGALIALVSGATGHAEAPPAIPEAVAAAPDLSVVATLHAQGAQVFECRAGADGRLAWQFREPVATLVEGGRTVGRHYAGPSWELTDGSIAVVGRVTGRAPGGGAGDIPWLRLEVAERRGAGRLAPITVIQRINTVGGAAEGACPTAGALRSVPYAADYVFLSPRGH